MGIWGSQGGPCLQSQRTIKVPPTPPNDVRSLSPSLLLFLRARPPRWSNRKRAARHATLLSSETYESDLRPSPPPSTPQAAHLRPRADRQKRSKCSCCLPLVRTRAAGVIARLKGRKHKFRTLRSTDPNWSSRRTCGGPLGRDARRRVEAAQGRLWTRRRRVKAVRGR